MSTYPCARPNVGAQLKNGQLEHEVNACDELNDPAHGVKGSPHQMEYMAGASIGAEFKTCKMRERKSTSFCQEKPAGIAMMEEESIGVQKQRRKEKRGEHGERSMKKKNRETKMPPP